MKRLLILIGVLLSACEGSMQISTQPAILPTDSPTPTPTPTLAPTPTPQPLPEEILTLLEEWTEGQEDYTGIAIQAGEAGWEVVIERVDGGEVLLFALEDGMARFEVLGSHAVVEVELGLPETKVTGGFEKLYFGTEAGEGHYMWRYPWGGWVENWNKTIEENGVGITVNEAELYGGLVTINPEQVEETWTNFVTGVYNVNKISKNTDILSRYPTAESFLRAARDGVVFESLRFLAPHPNNSEPRSALSATWETLTNVDLTSVTLSFPELSHELAKSFNPNTYSGITYYGNRGHFGFSPGTYFENGAINLRFSLARFRLEDDILNLPGLNPENPPEKNLKVLTQLVKGFEASLHLLERGHMSSGALLYNENFKGGPLVELIATDSGLSDYGASLFFTISRSYEFALNPSTIKLLTGQNPPRRE